jgi:hypothetical protein
VSSKSKLKKGFKDLVFHLLILFCLFVSLFGWFVLLRQGLAM